MKRADVNVAAAAGLSVYLPLHWLSTRLTDECGNPEPLTALMVGVLLLSLASYLLAPLLLSLLSRFPLAARTPLWLSVPVVGSGIFITGYVAALAPARPSLTVGGVAVVWLALSLWTMPASAAVYYFGAAVRLIKRWHRGPDYSEFSLLK